MKNIQKLFLLHLFTILSVTSSHGFISSTDSVKSVFPKSQQTFNTHAFNFSLGDTSKPPKITLFPEWVRVGKSGDKVYNYFCLNDDGVKIKTGKNYKELGGYVLKDKEAGVIFSDCIKKKKNSFKCMIAAVISFIPFTALILSDIESPIISLSALSFTAFTIASIILGKKSSKLLRKSVRTYNFNSGYGNVCGDDLKP